MKTLILLILLLVSGCHGIFYRRHSSRIKNTDYTLYYKRKTSFDSGHKFTKGVFISEIRESDTLKYYDYIIFYPDARVFTNWITYDSLNFKTIYADTSKEMGCFGYYTIQKDSVIKIESHSGSLFYYRYFKYKDLTLINEKSKLKFWEIFPRKEKIIFTYVGLK